MYFCGETPTPLSGRHIPVVEDLLTAHSVAFAEEAEVLRCELSAFGMTHSVVYIISAENVLCSPDESVEQMERRLRRVQSSLFEAEVETTPRRHLYLFLVWGADDDRDPRYLPQRWAVENNLRLAKKAFMQADDVLSWLQNPFPIREMASRANGVPLFTTMRPRDFPAQMASSANVWFDAESELDRLAAEYAEPAFEPLKAIAGNVYRRMMGSMSKVFWDAAGPRLGQVYDQRGVALDFCSAGERRLFALAVFLARSSLDTTAGLCVALPQTFNGIDQLRQIGAFDCLREFIAATSISVEIQAMQNEKRALALSRVRLAVESAGGQVIDRGVDFG
jgi:CRISPR/Cas system-associated endoribonuclease Cas2